MKTGTASALALLLAACSGEPTPAPSPTPTPVATPTVIASARTLAPGELPTPELDGAAPLAGTWRFQASASGSAARYDSGEALRFAVRCDSQARRIVFVAAGEGSAIRLFTPDAAATFPAKRIDGTLEAAVTTGQTFLDALAKARTIGVGGGDGPIGRLPGDRSIGDVVARCRPGGGR
ncbi:hypothetical protein ASG37_09425 [Sphingomonas sp. Leaf407]|uniref:hypothetical protein n=1 Tax=unclassified Sphingomonas TaxID=196159 RepID=UPI0006FDC0D5|nr:MULTISPECIES: hypothetical protein [unclassified Sphingomonas]KQN37285.1 hypothetical protein ASE97_06715 [Sphingomonas sp. Leaf42]KQT27653.1 hypothetical protein ASG37_09425 [Sphingomonas sp. Leaf407]